MTSTTTTTPRLPVPVYVLALTIFCLGTSEFMIAGLLPDIADDLGVSVPAVGGLISSFAVGMLVGAPVMTLLTLRLPRRTMLLASATVFALAHLVVLASDDYGVLLASRVVAAVACATFWAVSAVTVVALTPAGTTARALAVLVGGLTLANVVGVPAGTWVGDHFGWRTTFVAVAGATLATLVVTWRAVPETREVSTSSLAALARREIGALADVRLLVTLATTAAFQASIFCTFSYLAPLLIEVAGLRESTVPVVLLLFGVGTFLGITIGGRYSDRNLLGAVLICFGLLAASLVALAVSASSPVLVWVTVFLFGATGFSVASAINARVFVRATQAPTLASAVNVSAFNTGNALGPWIGGLVIAAGWGYTAPIWASLALIGLAFALASLSWVLEREPRRVITPACVDCPA